jgi:putative DNA primase/helicase
MRDGRGIAVKATHHPDPRVEAVRWAICEAGLIQAIGRGRGVNRTANNPLQIDILTNVVLPLEVDEVTTWERIQPRPAPVMAAEGAVPLTYPDMADSAELHRAQHPVGIWSASRGGPRGVGALRSDGREFE